jgi:glycosyltransferase involved in cell wall biosynthesis
MGAALLPVPRVKNQSMGVRRFGRPMAILVMSDHAYTLKGEKMWPVSQRKEDCLDFSIIIPTYNSSKYIGSCLASIFLSDYAKTKYEVILVDGGSTDGTLEIASYFSGVKCLGSNNCSISNSRNIGAKAANSDNLLFVDSDCLVDNRLLQKAYEYLKTYECCGGFYKPHLSHSWVSKTWLVLEQKPAGLVKWITAGTLAVRKQVFDAVGGFSEFLHTGEDVNFGMKLEKNRFKIFNDPSIGSIHLGQADNLVEFFKKEMWRGRSLIDGLMDFRNRTIRGIVFDALILLTFLLLAILVIMLLSNNLSVFLFVLAVFLMIPLALSIRKIPITKTPICILQSFVLYTFYLSARSASILYYNQIRKLLRRGSVAQAED